MRAGPIVSTPRLVTRRSPVRILALSPTPGYYHAPLYRAVASDERVVLHVLFGSTFGIRAHDAGFGTRVTWNADQMSGYSSEFAPGAETAELEPGFFVLSDGFAAQRLREGAFDVLWIHGYAFASVWRAVAAARRHGVPVLIREEQTLLHRRTFMRSLPRAALLRLLFARSYGLYISSNNGDFFRAYGIPSERLFFAPYSVENDDLQATARSLESKRTQLRDRFGLPRESGPVILFVGKLSEKKDPHLLLDAFARLRGHVRCTLLLVGEGPLRPGLEAFIESTGVADVRFAGFLNRDRIGEAYSVADVFVLPSAAHETFGLVVPEAMNFGLPVVASTSVGCARDLVRDGVNGFIVQHGDADALAERLGRLVGDAELRAAFGAVSRELVRGWTYSRAADGIVAAALVAGRTRGAT